MKQKFVIELFSKRGEVEALTGETFDGECVDMDCSVVHFSRNFVIVMSVDFIVVETVSCETFRTSGSSSIMNKTNSDENWCRS